MRMKIRKLICEERETEPGAIPFWGGTGGWHSSSPEWEVPEHSLQEATLALPRWLLGWGCE